MSSFSPYQEYYRNLNHFSSKRSYGSTPCQERGSMWCTFSTNAATCKTNSGDNSVTHPIGEGFTAGGGFNINTNSPAESSNEQPTLEYLQRFFGIKPEDKPAEEEPCRRKSFMY
jgi:hypothetical protein